ncbi:c-type cytochrome [Limimaricola cinnabarinus]|jgi:mono/diheme cytochrome c family protein|uniref:Cytochrome c domain-containing protein n=1 Tax=Limimaricola cinnabarinus TaxID=1125964 RepID=A0A2G1MJL6_9RHOB|nr:cytochrome c [Limimaricola cinnabarinus]PHP28941.1 hypothetical protein CJ301_04380 [Limimaricola cinnabarinus]
MSGKNEHPEDFGTGARDLQEHFEPHELKNPIPWPLIAIAATLAIWGGATLLFDARATTTGRDALLAQGRPEMTPSLVETAAQEGDAAAARSAALYDSYCATCHQTNGAGVRGAVPPLDGSEYVLADAALPVSILLRGLSGPIVVDGEVYDARMPTWHATLGDEEIAGIVTHVRGAWSNDAGPVSAEQVAATRAALSAELDRPWAGGAELFDAFGEFSETMADDQPEEPRAQ